MNIELSDKNMEYLKLLSAEKGISINNAVSLLIGSHRMGVDFSDLLSNFKTTPDAPDKSEKPALVQTVLKKRLRSIPMSVRRPESDATVSVVPKDIPDTTKTESNSVPVQTEHNQTLDGKIIDNPVIAERPVGGSTFIKRPLTGPTFAQIKLLKKILPNDKEDMDKLFLEIIGEDNIEVLEDLTYDEATTLISRIGITAQNLTY